jgi:uncharacterized protein (TIGR03083 family)
MAVSRYAAAPTLDFVAAYAAAAATVVEMVPRLDMHAGVPACPGWSTYDLLVHLGNVHGWAATIVETGDSAPRRDDQPPSRRSRAVAEWYAGKAEDLLAVLRGGRPDRLCWTFSAQDRTQAFWARRQTHETLVHLVDLHQADLHQADLDAADLDPADLDAADLDPADLHPPGWGAIDVPAWLAADGVDEVLTVFMPRMHARGRAAELSAPVLLRARDTGDTWLLAPREEEPPAAERVVGSDLAEAETDLVSAPAAELMLLLWKRLGPDHPAVTLDGDRARVLAFLGSPLTS